MRRYTLLVVLGVFLCSSMPGRAHEPSPPKTALWAEEPNGDAIQKDLGFILPRKWKSFDRQGFSSTRPDGASVKAYYLSEDKAITLAILLQLRADVRGFELPQDAVWVLIKASADVEYSPRAKSKPVELSSDAFSLGKRTPAGRTRWTRHDLESGAEVQGLWWQNIGIWSVVITLSGPEARRADIEAYANTLLAEMPFPSAPIATEISVTGEKLFASMPKCSGTRPDGAGTEVTPPFQEAALLSLLMPGMVLGLANDSLITPVTRGKDYCLIETFLARKDLQVTAIQYSGPATGAWEARYGFALNNGKGGYYQVERLADHAALQALPGGAEAKNHAYLNFSNNKRASVFTVFNDWPSYEAAKKAVSTIHATQENRQDPILTMTHPAGKVEVVNNPARVLTN